MSLFGKIFKNILPIASIAAAPFTSGTSLLSNLSSVGSILSAVSSAQQLFGGSKQPKEQNIPAAQAPAFNPQKPNAINAPDSLGAEFSGFSPEQQRSALATKGVNTGLGSEENAYYRNLVQRSLIGDNNSVDTSNPNFLSPIESQYFSRQGVNTSDVMKFLQGISQ